VQRSSAYIGLGLCVFAGLICHLASGQQSVSQPAPQDECSPTMNEGECDRQTEHDLMERVQRKDEKCHFEPGWRPTNLRDRALHVTGISSGDFSFTVDGKSYCLVKTACRGDCSHWKPEVRKDYISTITNQSKYLNGCLQRYLPAKRAACIRFGKLKSETLPYGVSTSSQFEVCYSLPTH
jgi:hypothetical protein